MGYYTHFKLDIISPPDNATLTRVWSAGKELTGYFERIFSVDNETDVSLIETNECEKWYDHEEDMKALSKDFPDTIFKLSGVGEEAFVFIRPKNHIDIWTKYFKNGKMQECQANVTFDEFDENKLK